MAKMLFNYDSEQYEEIDRDGYSYTQGKYVYNWDNSEYTRNEEEELLMQAEIERCRCEEVLSYQDLEQIKMRYFVS